MKKFFAANKRTLPGGDGNCPSSGKTSKIGAGYGSPSCSTTSGAGPIQSKEDSLVMLMNQAGMRMQELRNILHQESVLARRDPDTLKLQAFIRHYLRQIEVVDAILHCDPKITRTEGYHLFAEDLQHHKSFDHNESKLPVGASVTCGKSGDEIVEQDGSDAPASLSPAVCREEVNDDGNVSDTGLFSPSNSEARGHDELDACTLPPHKVEDEFVEAGYRQSKKHLKNLDLHIPIDSTPISSKFLSSDDESSGKRKVQDYLKKYAEQQSNFESESDQDIIDASLRACTKNKSGGLRKPKKLRGRLDQIFPLIPDSFAKPLMASTPTSSGFPEHDFAVNRTNDDNMICQSTIEDNSLACGDIEDPTPWKDRSKSKNESWYEFKERCSRTSLHSLSQQSNSPTRISHQKSSFLIKDYVDGPQVPKTAISPNKCVRFNLGPRERTSDDTSCESSTDDEAPFEVDQFPCAKPAYRKSHRGHKGKH